MNKYIEIKEEKLKNIAPLDIVQEISIIGMYDLVFQDCVRCYLDELNYDEEKVSLTEEEIKRIAYKMIYKNDYLWEIINETINMYIGNILNERETDTYDVCGFDKEKELNKLHEV